MPQQPTNSTPLPTQMVHSPGDTQRGAPPPYQQPDQQSQQTTQHHTWEAAAPLGAPTYYIPRQPPWQQQPATARETDYTRGMQTPAQLTPLSTSQYQSGTPQTTVNPSWLQLISGTVLATIANLQQNTILANGTNQQRNITTTTRSAKLLNGTNKHSLLGFCGHSIQESPPEIFIILDSNEDTTTKFHALED